MDYPYQLVTFLGKEPEVGELIYEGPNGWYPQVALKRRFGLRGITEEEFITSLKTFLSHYQQFEITTGKAERTPGMPVDSIKVLQTAKLMQLHNNFFKTFEKQIISKYPERERNNYYPHITIEWAGKRVVNESLFSDKKFAINKVWLVKDEGADSKALLGVVL